MIPETGTAVLILVAFILPGFVTLLISERTHAVSDRSSASERLLLALYYSVLTYAVLGVLAWATGYERADLEHLRDGEQSLGKLLWIALLAILIIPAAIATISRIWLRSRTRKRLVGWLRISLSHKTPTAWDHFFEQQRDAFVRATLTDGRVVGGYYGSESFATYGEQARDLFIANQWVLDDDFWFENPAEGGIGLWLPRDSIVSLEFYAVPSHE